jgi:hypothetical protein
MALLTLTGLISALLGDGIWDALSALTLGIPVASGAWYGLRHKVRTKTHHPYRKTRSVGPPSGNDFSGGTGHNPA